MKKLLKNTEQRIKTSYSAWYKTRFHFKEKNLKGIKSLSEQQKREIIEVWKPYHCHYKIKFLQYYCHFSGYSAYYLPDDVWYNTILPYYNNRTLAQQIDDKCLYDIFLRNLPMPQAVLKIIDGRMYDSDYNIITMEKADSIMHDASADLVDLIIKPSVASCGGKRIKRFYDLRLESISDIKKEYPNAIMQRIVIQSDCLSRLNASSINTIRISSLILNDGTLVIPSAVMRMGANGSIVDNGGVFTGIDIVSGTLKKYGHIRKAGQYESFLSHPNSKVIFENYEIQGFQKIIELIRNNARYLPKTRLLGWDFTLDANNEPVMIEVNIEDHDLAMMQMANGPYFADQELMARVLTEVFEGEKKCLCK